MEKEKVVTEEVTDETLPVIDSEDFEMSNEMLEELSNGKGNEGEENE